MLTFVRIVFGPGAKDWMPEMRINALNISDLCEIKPPEKQQAQQQAQQQQYYAPSVEAAALPVLPPQKPIDDPAILSLGRHAASSASSARETARERTSPKLLEELELEGLGDDDTPGVLRGIHVGRGGRLSPIEDVADHIEKHGLEAVEQPTTETEAGKTTDMTTDTDNKSQKRRRRHRKSKKANTNSDAESLTGPMPQPAGHGKGWRQTPILQSTSSFQPFSTLKRNGKGRKGDEFGWESTEVTEEMGDFDFENNLAKFDKRTIFEQMRKEDQIDDSARLVSHNRRPKPGTNGGKHLHYTENVLDLPSTIAKNTGFWNSEADDPNGLNSSVASGERLSGREVRNVATTRRAESKNGVPRRSQSRKASAGGVTSSQPLSRVGSNVSRAIRPRRRHCEADNLQQQAYQPGLYIMGTTRRIEVISTLQMLNLENIAANEVGFTEDLMAENAGRGLAEVAVRALSGPAMRMRFEMASSNQSGEALLSTSTAVILAGNNKSSIRALAAARHLRNRNIEVVICMVGIERERDLLEDLRRQVELYRSFGGKVMSKMEFFEYLRKNAASGTRIPISLIIDAMLGLTMSFEDLRVGDQATVYELMEWANRNEAFVMAVDIPSGIDPSTGKIAIIDGSPLYIKPRYVVSMGAPKRGLLEAVTPPRDDDPEPLHHHAIEDEWQLFVADIGLGMAVWRKAGTKLRRGIDFDGQWVLDVEFRTSSAMSSEERER